MKAGMPRIRVGLLAALLLAPLLLTSCGKLNPAPTPWVGAPFDRSSMPPLVTLSPAAENRWKWLSSTCPTLKTKVPGLPAAVGEGTPGIGYLDNGILLTADCFWKTDGRKQPDVTVSVLVFREDMLTESVEQLATDYMRKSAEEIRQEATKYLNETMPPQVEPGLGDEAFLYLRLTFRALYLTVRSANAVISVKLHLGNLENGVKVSTDWLLRHRPAALAVARDVLDNLR